MTRISGSVPDSRIKILPFPAKIVFDSLIIALTLALSRGALPGTYLIFFSACGHGVKTLASSLAGLFVSTKVAKN